jgi:hypothetical protein
MSTPDQYRAKAAEFAELAKAGNAPDEAREFHKMERSFTALADNEQWLADNHDKAVHAPGRQRGGGISRDASMVPGASADHASRAADGGAHGDEGLAIGAE